VSTSDAKPNARQRQDAAWVELTASIETAVADDKLAGRSHAVFPIAWGWHRTVTRQGQACRVLVANDLAYETTTIRRSMLEHTIYLLLLAAEPDATIDMLNTRHQYLTRQQKAATAAAGWEYDTPELTAFLEAQLPNNPLNHLGQVPRAASHVGRQGLSAAWTSDSRNSHPGVVSARMFYEDDESHIELLHEPVPVGDPGDLAICMNLMCLLDATDALNQLSATQPFTADIARGLRVLKATTPRSN